MYLKSIEINNFRKFGSKDNLIGFVKANSGNNKKSPVASSTTLIVGKNNAGKTTITKALEFIVDEGDKLVGSYFNFDYLNDLLNKYIQDDYSKTPELSFILDVILDNGDEDLTTNFGNFITIKDSKENREIQSAKVKIVYEVKDKELFESNLKKGIAFLSLKKRDRVSKFKFLVDIISETQFRRIVKGLNGRGEKNIRLKDIIDLKVISASNNIHDKRLLAKSFNKIIRYMYEVNDRSFQSINNLVEKNNNRLTGKIRRTHQRGIQSVLEEIVSENALAFSLRADLTFDKLMTDLVTYEYIDGDHHVPEGQFGLGYTNLINILSEIIDFSYKCKYMKKQSKVQVLCIEEPELFMHPQMQVNFIRHIEEALSAILKLSKRDVANLKSQIVITTHSSHILNSVIQESCSLDEVNYTYPENGQSKNIIIKDSDIAKGKNESDYFQFIKKHIKHQVPELFFSDAIILVEGITEERVVNFFIENDIALRRKKISVFRIDGAHGSVYIKLLNALRIPSLIITDIDFKREKESLYEEVEAKDNKIIKVPLYPQIEIIDENTLTTNKTLTFIHGSPKVNTFKKCFVKENVRVSYQIEPVEIYSMETLLGKYYATSFEEALILENYNNPLFKDILKTVIPSVIDDLLGSEDIDETVLFKNSYRLQKNLSESKSKFSNSIIYALVNSPENSEEKIKIPKYIKEGIDWLSNYKFADEVEL
ncbi:AAA family ATPase [Pantoea anthophila]|uniref:AAA family ATPase n=1 Tax=Pantoea anthophila TaxID=470931 RepID=UPI00301D3648